MSFVANLHHRGGWILFAAFHFSHFFTIKAEGRRSSTNVSSRSRSSRRSSLFGSFADIREEAEYLGGISLTVYTSRI